MAYKRPLCGIWYGSEAREGFRVDFRGVGQLEFQTSLETRFGEFC